MARHRLTARRCPGGDACDWLTEMNDDHGNSEAGGVLKIEAIVLGGLAIVAIGSMIATLFSG